MHSSVELDQLQGDGIQKISDLVSSTSAAFLDALTRGLLPFRGAPMAHHAMGIGHKGIHFLFMLPALLQSSVKSAR